jgi:hypothetical protein
VRFSRVITEALHIKHWEEMLDTSIYFCNAASLAYVSLLRVELTLRWRFSTSKHDTVQNMMRLVPGSAAPFDAKR